MTQPTNWQDIVDVAIEELREELLEYVTDEDYTLETWVHLPAPSSGHGTTQPNEVPGLLEGWFDHEDYEGSHTYNLGGYSRDDDHDMDEHTWAWRMLINVTYLLSEREERERQKDEQAEHDFNTRRANEW